MLRRMKSRHREILTVGNVFQVGVSLTNDPLGCRLHPPLVRFEPLGVTGEEIVFGQIVQNPARPAVVDQFIGGIVRVAWQFAIPDVTRTTDQGRP